ncbi:hypothetical protein WJX72_000636 [[Myrmecia] bisecta]|uniref:Mic1 domain-containing protein n=1 Tax=[Myrmecia] bisecta TaxID=41462 RepID=A0AAW1QNP6_9CHLO
MMSPGQVTEPSPHVLLQDTGIRFESSGNSLRYDDVSLQLLAVRGQDVVTHRLAPGKAVQVTPVGDGPPIMAVRASGDGSLLAVQRSPLQLQFVHRSTLNMFVQGANQRNSPITGFLWARSGDCDFVMVTPTGLELFQLAPSGQGLRFLDARRHPIKWHMYSHETRIALLGTGEIGLWLQAYQFTSEGIIKLPPFQIAATTPQDSARAPPLSHLDPDDIRLMTMYGRIYCSYIDRREQRLYLYRFYKDAVMLQHQYDLAGKQVHLSVVNNLLLAHHVRPNLVMVIDVCAATSSLLLRPQPIGVAQASPEAPAPNLQQLRFELPNLMLDSRAGVIWRCALDMAAIAKSSQDWPALVAFLQRRRPAGQAGSLPGTGADIKGLTLAIIKGVLVERQPMHVVRPVLDAVNAAFVESTGSQPASGSNPLRRYRSMPCIAPQEMVSQVLQWLHDEEATDAQYLQAAVAEYLASTEVHNVVVPPALHTLALDIALQQGHAAQVVATLATQPQLDSAILAEHLELLAKRGALPESRQLARAMWSRLGMYDQVCRMLLQQGAVLEAMRCARRHSVQSIPETAFLHAAAKTGDIGTFTAVYRACHQSAPAALPEYAEAYKQYTHFFRAQANDVA